MNRPSYPVSGNKKPYYGGYGVGKPSYPVSETKKPYYGSYGDGNPQHLRHDSLMQMIKPISYKLRQKKHNTIKTKSILK